METPVLAIFRDLNFLGMAILALIGLLTVYLALKGKYYILFAFLVLGASFVGSIDPRIDSVASILRWGAVLALFLLSLFLKRIMVPTGSLLFLGYVAFGFLFLFFSNSDSWQFQRSVLLIIVAAAIPFVYGDQPLKTMRLTLIGLAAVATVFATYNFLSLPGHLQEAARLSGFAKGAPWFSMVLSGLLPFSLWGVWWAPHKGLRVLFGGGFLFGVVTLVFTGQRAGTLAGLLGVAPLLIMNLRKRRTVGVAVLLLMLLSSLGYVLFQQSSSERMDFLLKRYNRQAGLSAREGIWDDAMAEINRNPLQGHGTGGAETALGGSFHSTWLEVWYNTGLPGLLFFIAAQIYFFYRIIFLSRIVEDPESRSILALALGSMLGFALLCGFESIGAGASNVNVILYLFLGVVVSKKGLFDAPVQPDALEAEAETP